MKTAQLLETLSNCLNIDTSSGAVQIFGDLQQGTVKSALLYADSNGKLIAAPAGVGGGGGLTSVTITSSMVTTALGYTPYNSINPSGYLTNTTGDARYLRLTGGTLSGGLSGTSASFSTTLGVTGALTGGSTASFTSSVTASAFFESSDKNLKTLLKSDYIPYGIERIESRLYIKDGREELGYFAQDVESILPSAVTVREDGLLSLSYREVHTAKIARLEKELEELKAKLNIL